MATSEKATCHHSVKEVSFLLALVESGWHICRQCGPFGLDLLLWLSGEFPGSTDKFETSEYLPKTLK